MALQYIVFTPHAVAGDPVISKRLRRARYSIDIVWLERYHKFCKEAQAGQLPFLGPENPQELLNELEKIQGEIGHYRECREFSEYLNKLKALFAEPIETKTNQEQNEGV